MESSQLSFLEPPEPVSEVRVSAPLDARSPLRRAIELFHEHLITAGRSINTVRAFDSDLRLFQRYIGAHVVIGHIRYADLYGFVRWLKHGRGVACNAKSLARRITTIKVLYGWLAATRVLPHNLAVDLEHPHVETPLPRVLSTSEVDQLLSAAESMRRDSREPDARPLLLITLLLGTGLKKSECMALTPGDIDTTEEEGATVFIRYDSARKRHKERRLRLPDGFSVVFDEYRDQYRPVTHLFECTARNLEYVLDIASRRAGLPPRRACFEVLRYTCALRDLRGGMEPDRLRMKLGISEITWADTLERLERLNTPVI
jgi:integrase/recombinase XerD